MHHFRTVQNLARMTSPVAVKGFCQRVRIIASGLLIASALHEKYTSQMKASGQLGSQDSKVIFNALLFQ